MLIAWSGLPVAVFMFGALMGSFLNVVIIRFANSIKHQALGIRHDDGTTGSNLQDLGGRSYCPQCTATLRWWELVPLLSFMLLRGQCARCGTEISVQYPLVELGTGLLFMVLARPWYSAMLLGPSTGFRVNDVYATDVTTLAMVLLAWLIASLLVVLLVIDLKTMLLPDVYVGSLLLAVVVNQLIFNFSRYSGIPLAAGQFSIFKVTIGPSVLGAGIGAGFLLLLWLVTRGRGIGWGDVKLLIPLGALFGVGGTILLLWLSFVAGGLVGGWLLLTQRARLGSAVPFGPFLCGAALLLLVLPELPHVILQFWLGGMLL